MRWLTKAAIGKTVMGLAVGGFTGVIVAACGSSGDSSAVFPGAPDATADGDNGPTGSFEDGGKFADVLDIDAYYFNDPPPQWCGPAGGATPPPAPGGTSECPADKNRQGCACPVEGEVASCWPGPRANRNLGVCKDGTTKCTKSGELTTAWGPCVGTVLPTPGATKGAAACKCFSAGQWDIKNVIPCFWTQDSTPPGGGPTVTTTGVHSTYLTGTTANCLGTTKPAQDFSTDTLKVDCEGTFNLCMVIKAGDLKNPKPSDCAIMNPVCTEPTDYPTKNAVKAFPSLKSWEATTAAQKTCADTFKANGGYAELSVLGKSYTCDAIDDGAGQSYVFQRFQYCPFKCNDSANKALPECATCANGASGQF